ncbi:MAG TPA: nucleoside triphosphate pyrophosphatase [Isosphaeraceae bacterium]|nr:nucleoside triphosphate pyrophosphatase [Isosphaeraceae bacterium]
MTSEGSAQESTRPAQAPCDLVLASTSPYRRALLERLGVPFRCVAPRVDEDAIKGIGLAPRELAERLALAKAMSLCALEPQATLIGSDQVVSFGGQAFGKPGSVLGAIETLAALAGRSHELITAVAVWHRGQVVTHTDRTILHMRPLDREEIERYVAADQPMDCAGAYKLEARGIALFDRIETEDQTAITGLPLIALTTILRGLGYRIP